MAMGLSVVRACLVQLAVIVVTATAETTDNTDVASVLTRLSLPQLAPAFEAAGIDHDALLLLDLETLTKYFPSLNLGARLKLYDYIRQRRAELSEQQQQQQPGRAVREAASASATAIPSGGRSGSAVAVGELLTSTIRAEVHAATAETVAAIVEDNNAVLLERVSAMIDKKIDEKLDETAAADHRPQAQAQQPPRSTPPRLLQGGQSTGNADQGSLWLEDDDGKIVIGAQADAELHRAGANVVGTGGGFSVGGGLSLGTVEDAQCPGGTAGSGTLRFNEEKEKMQICTLDGWKTAGGAKLEPYDETCNADAAGMLRFQDGAFWGCDGVHDWWVVLGQPTPAPTGLPSVEPTGAPTVVSYVLITPSGFYHADQGAKYGNDGATTFDYGCDWCSSAQRNYDFYCPSPSRFCRTTFFRSSALHQLRPGPSFLRSALRFHDRFELRALLLQLPLALQPQQPQGRRHGLHVRNHLRQRQRGRPVPSALRRMWRPE